MVASHTCCTGDQRSWICGLERESHCEDHESCREADHASATDRKNAAGMPVDHTTSSSAGETPRLQAIAGCRQTVTTRDGARRRLAAARTAWTSARIHGVARWHCWRSSPGSSPASAQERGKTSAPPRYELGTVTGATSGPAGELATSYSPPLVLDGDYTSHGGQTLFAALDWAIGFSAGINIFPAPRVGLQVMLDRVSSPVSGSNPPYAFGLQYTVGHRRITSRRPSA